jgi:hypothetical protein
MNLAPGAGGKEQEAKRSPPHQVRIGDGADEKKVALIWLDLARFTLMTRLTVVRGAWYVVCGRQKLTRIYSNLLEFTRIWPNSLG